jgi:PTS system mannose-specific IID component
MMRWQDLLRVFVRSFSIQALWNPEGLQNGGFLYVISPALNRLYPEREEKKRAYIRHLESFNTHPYMANLIIGYTISKEEQVKRGGGKEGEISSIKRGMFGPLAVIGDTLFWAGLRPLLALLASILAIYGSVLGGVIFLILYNLIHIPTRFLGLISGYRLGDGVVRWIKRLQFKRISWHLKVSQVVVCGLGGGSFVCIDSESSPLLVPLYLSLGVLFVLGIRRGISPKVLFFSIIGICILVSSLLGG